MTIILSMFFAKQDLRIFKKAKWDIAQSIICGIVFLIGFRIIYFSFVKTGLFPNTSGVIPASIHDMIASINLHYGYVIGVLIVCVLVPIYEEIMFRGIMLGSLSKKMNFHLANCIQSFFFAVVHENFSLFPFYFFFALSAGHFFKKSGNLIASIIFHATNNIIAFSLLSSIQ